MKTTNRDKAEILFFVIGAAISSYLGLVAPTIFFMGGLIVLTMLNIHREAMKK